MIGDIASVATSIGVLIAIYQLMLSRQQARAVFGQQLCRQVWSIEDDRLRKSDRDAVNRRRYLRLCEDQYEHARLKQISTRTWDIWHEGIVVGIGSDLEHAGAWTKLCVQPPQSMHSGSDCPVVKRS